MTDNVKTLGDLLKDFCSSDESAAEKTIKIHYYYNHSCTHTANESKNE